MKKILSRELVRGGPCWLLKMRWLGNQKEYKWKGYFLGCMVYWACCAGTRLVGPVQNIFSSPYTISMPLTPSPSELGRQPCLVAFLLICVSAISLVKRPVCPLVKFRHIHILFGREYARTFESLRVSSAADKSAPSVCYNIICRNWCNVKKQTFLTSFSAHVVEHGESEKYRPWDVWPKHRIKNK